MAVGRTKRPRSPSADEVAARFDVGISAAQIADEFSCTTRTVRNVAHRAGVALPLERRTRRRSALLDDPVWLANAVLEEGKSPTDLVAELGGEHSEVIEALQRAGVEVPRRVRFPQLYEVGWLQAAFDLGGSLHSVAREVGCSRSAVRAAVCDLGVTRRPLPRRYPQLGEVDWLRDRYVRRRQSISRIAGELGCRPATVTRALRAAGIATRGPVRRRPPPADRLKADWAIFGQVNAVARLNDVNRGLAEVWLAEVGVFGPTRTSIAAPEFRRLVADGASISELGRHFGVDRYRVRVELMRHGLKIRRRRARVRRPGMSAVR